LSTLNDEGAQTPESVAEKPPTPLKWRIGKLTRPMDYRRAFKRIAVAVLEGRINPRVAGTAGYLLNCGLKSLESEGGTVQPQIGPGLTVILQQAIKHEHYHHNGKGNGKIVDHSLLGLPGPES